MKLTLFSRKHIKIRLAFYRAFKSTPVKRHHFRSELWLFLFGRGLVEAGDFPDVMEYYDTGHRFFSFEPHEWHRYMATRFTVVLEIQYGKKCKGNDIERL